MKHFKSAHQVQRFFSIHAPIANLPGTDCRTARAFEAWAEVAGARLAA